MSTEADIVERLQQPVMLHSSAEHTNAERREAAAEITKLRAERDRLLEKGFDLIEERNAAARDMRERCKVVATKRLTSLEKLRDTLHTPEAKGNVRDSMDQVLIVLGAIAALPDTVIATSGKDAT